MTIFLVGRLCALLTVASHGTFVTSSVAFGCWYGLYRATPLLASCPTFPTPVGLVGYEPPHLPCSMTGTFSCESSQVPVFLCLLCSLVTCASSVRSSRLRFKFRALNPGMTRRSHQPMPSCMDCARSCDWRWYEHRKKSTSSICHADGLEGWALWVEQSSS